MPSKYIHLTEMQKKTILTLAQNGPMSGYDFHLGGKRTRGNRKALMSSGEWHKIRKALGANGSKIIEQIKTHGSKSYDERGRRKDLYWLTENGLVSAIINNCNLAVLLGNVKKVYPNDSEKSLLVEISITIDRELGRDILGRMLFMSMQPNINEMGRLGLILAAFLQGKEAETLQNEFVRVLQKYPRYHMMFNEGLKKSEKQIKKMRAKLSEHLG